MALDYTTPVKRPLQVYAFDPTLGRHLGNEMTISVRYEKLGKGPVGERFAVVDYDGSTKTFLAPVDLDDPKILICGGLDPTESDPRFHQQMVYAVASETLERFEAALGRRLHWRYPLGPDKKPVARRRNRLYLFPHAMVQANAFYDPDTHGILFGYFRAGDVEGAQVLPGQTIFTCLSHDIIAHETTHAVVDGIRPGFMEPTNVDVPAFHEAFADLAALFRHFSHREVLLDTLQRTGGMLYQSTLRADVPGAAPTAPAEIEAQVTPDNPLIELARQFGQVSGLHSGLRSALGTPQDPHAIMSTTEPHARGAILVAAVFDAYFSVYVQQTADLFRTFRAGGGSANPVELPGPLANLLAIKASRTAELFFSVCARALDYCPPIDITFGDFLRALITADLDLYPSDSYNVRDAVMQAFRARGILPSDAAFFSEDALRWPVETELPAVRGLIFGDPNGLTNTEQDRDATTLWKYADKHRAALGIGRGEISVPSFHPTFRTDEDGMLKIDMVAVVLEDDPGPRSAEPSPDGPQRPRAGATLIIEKSPIDADRSDATETVSAIRYVIKKRLGPSRDAAYSAAVALGLTDDRGRIKFSSLHGGV